jgi:hypothetical protein
MNLSEANKQRLPTNYCDFFFVILIQQVVVQHVRHMNGIYLF